MIYHQLGMKNVHKHLIINILPNSVTAIWKVTILKLEWKKEWGWLSLEYQIPLNAALHCSLLVWKDASNGPDAFLNHSNSFQIQSCYIYTFTQLFHMFLSLIYILNSQRCNWRYSKQITYFQIQSWNLHFVQNVFPRPLLCKTYFLFFTISWIATIIYGFRASARNSVRISYILYSFWFPVSLYLGCRLYGRTDGWLCLWASWMDFRRPGKVSSRTHMHA